MKTIKNRINTIKRAKAVNKKVARTRKSIKVTTKARKVNKPSAQELAVATAKARRAENLKSLQPSRSTKQSRRVLNIRRVRSVKSAKNILMNSRYANTAEVKFFNKVVEKVKFQTMELMGLNENQYQCVFKPMKKKHESCSDKAMYLWVSQILSSKKPVKLGVALKSGKLIYVDVDIRCLNNGEVMVNVVSTKVLSRACLKAGIFRKYIYLSAVVISVGLAAIYFL